MNSTASALVFSTVTVAIAGAAAVFLPVAAPEAATAPAAQQQVVKLERVVIEGRRIQQLPTVIVEGRRATDVQVAAAEAAAACKATATC